MAIAIRIYPRDASLPTPPTFSTGEAITLTESDLIDYQATLSETDEFYSSGRADLTQSGSLTFTTTNRTPYTGAFTPGQGYFTSGARGAVVELVNDGVVVWEGRVATAKQNYQAGKFGTVTITARGVLEILGRTQIAEFLTGTGNSAITLFDRVARAVLGNRYGGYRSFQALTNQQIITSSIDPLATVQSVFGTWLAMNRFSMIRDGGQLRLRAYSQKIYYTTEPHQITREYHDQTAYNAAMVTHQTEAGDGSTETTMLTTPRSYHYSLQNERAAAIDLKYFSKLQACNRAKSFINARAIPRFRTKLTLKLSPLALGDYFYIQVGGNGAPNLPGGNELVAGRIISRSVDFTKSTQTIELEDIRTDDLDALLNPSTFSRIITKAGIPSTAIRI